VSGSTVGGALTTVVVAVRTIAVCAVPVESSKWNVDVVVIVDPAASGTLGCAVKNLVCDWCGARSAKISLAVPVMPAENVLSAWMLNASSWSLGLRNVMV